MVYGYKTNKEFIDKSYQLLEKLENKNLWNKDTLIIGLDKSVRPLAYTLRKLSKEEGRETPDVRFFNFSSRHDFADSNPNEISENLKKISSPENISNYENIIILDEHIYSGRSLEGFKNILEKYFKGIKKHPKINMATLGTYIGGTTLDLKKDKFIMLENEKVDFPSSEETGVDDYKGYYDTITKSVNLRDKETRQKFIKNRHQLSSDIKNYLHEKHPEKVLGKSKGLENIISGIFIFSFLVGLFFSSNNLTGNVIGTSGSFHKLIGIILVLFGIGGFFVYRRIRRIK